MCNAIINFNIGFNVQNLTDKHWIYFPEKQYPFYRLGFWHNFSQHLVRKDCSAIYGEISYMPGTKTQRQLYNSVHKSINQIVTLLDLNKNTIVTEKILHLSHAYVIYDAWRKRNLSNLLQRLNNLNIHSIGRFGAWKYSSMQEAVLDGKNMAELCAKLSLNPTKTMISGIKDISLENHKSVKKHKPFPQKTNP